MIRRVSHNFWSIAGSVKSEPSVYMSANGTGGRLSITLTVMGRRWNKEARVFEDVLQDLPVSYYSDKPDEDAHNLTTGTYVIIDGHFEPRSYESNSGQRTVLEPRADNIDIIQPPKTYTPPTAPRYQQQTYPQSYGKPQQQVQPAPATQETPETFDSDEIPF